MPLSRRESVGALAPEVLLFLARNLLRNSATHDAPARSYRVECPKGRMVASRSRLSLGVFILVGFGVPWSAAVVARLEHIGFPEATPSFMIAGAFCSVAGVLATYIEEGSSGLKDLARRCVLYRVSLAWWVYALFLPLGAHVIATLLYGAAHHRFAPIRPMNLFHQWWMLYVWTFGLLQGPLGEELGWRGYLLPRLLRQHSPISASVILGLIWAAWHFEIFFHSVSADALFFASAVALSVLMTVLFLHTRGSVLLAIAMHGSVIPGRDIAQALFPTADQPPDWLRAVVAIVIALLVIAITRGNLTRRQMQQPVRYAERWPLTAESL